MTRLTENQFWASHYTQDLPQSQRGSREGFLKGLIRRLLGRKLTEYMRSYDDYLLWEVIYKRLMPATAGAKALEVGSAPGDYLLRLNKAFGFIPYGIEYTKSGAELNKKIFSLNGIDPAHVIHGDFFSDEFQSRYKGYFDVVVSRGFIEHFEEVGEVVQKHVRLLRPGGYLFISVPNFRGVYYLWLRAFRKEILAMHNLRIMRREEFAKLFPPHDLVPLFCNYYGMFSFDLFQADKNSLLRLVLVFCHGLQRILNVTFRVLFKDRGRESRTFSPHLLFVGTKKDATCEHEAVSPN